MAKRITKAPRPKPTGVTLSRADDNGGNSVKASWGIPADAKSDTNHRWTGVDEYWYWNAVKNKGGKLVPDVSKAVKEQRGNAHATGDVVKVRDKGMHDSNTQYFNRNAYYPVQSGYSHNRFLQSVKAEIHAYNGKAPHAVASATYTFRAPYAPSVAVKLDKETSKAQFTITAASDSGSRERYDTRWRVLRQSSYHAGYKGSFKQAKGWATFTGDSAEYSFDLWEALQLELDGWDVVRVEAYSRGLMGDSSHTLRDYVFCWPTKVTISAITASSLDASGAVRVTFPHPSEKAKVGDGTTAYIDTMKMQRLADTTLGNATAVASSSDWQDVDGAVDDGNACGFSDSVAGALPQARNHTWYRIATTYGGLTRYSDPVEAACLYRDSEPASDVAFASLKGGDAGKSIAMRLAWGDDEYTGVQVAWSENADAWRSNKEPSTFDLTDSEWDDGPLEAGGASYPHSTSFTVYGLDDGTDYYVRARRFADTDGVVSYAPWSVPAVATVAAVAEARSVSLDAPAAVARGEGLRVSWTFEGSTQRRWSLEASDASTGSWKALAGGSDASGSCTLPADGALASADSLVLRVGVSTATMGSLVYSAERTVQVTDRPALAMECPAALTAQPLSLTFLTDDPTATIAATVEAVGMVRVNGPDGRGDVQAAGDVVWAGDVQVTGWAERTFADAAATFANSAYSFGSDYDAAFSTPGGLAFHQGASYRVTATATGGNGLVSDEVSAVVTVDWAHRASAPSADSTAVPDAGALSATVTPLAGDGASDGDVCDVYRVTADGADLVASDVPWGTAVTDPYAPFSVEGPDEDGTGPLSYRLVCRTPDGDLDWVDVHYTMRHASLRIDWEGGSVDLPYDLAKTDSWEKGFEVSARWDGSRAGRWDAGAARKASLSTALVRAESAGDAGLLSALGSYAGACFVRTPDGAAFEADVQVTSYGAQAGSAAVSVALDATEVDLTDEFRIDPSGWGGGSEEGGE